MLVFLKTAWAILVETLVHPLSTSVIRIRGDRVSRTGPGRYPDEMRVVGYRKVAEHVYEVTTESASYGRVVRNVLVLPGVAMGPPVSGCDCGDR